MRKPFALMSGVLSAYGINRERLAEIIGKNKDTAQRRLRNPETFTLKEIAAINAAGVPADELRECIKFK